MLGVGFRAHYPQNKACSLKQVAERSPHPEGRQSHPEQLQRALLSAPANCAWLLLLPLGSPTTVALHQTQRETLRFNRVFGSSFPYEGSMSHKAWIKQICRFFSCSSVPVSFSDPARDPTKVEENLFFPTRVNSNLRPVSSRAVS